MFWVLGQDPKHPGAWKTPGL